MTKTINIKDEFKQLSKKYIEVSRRVYWQGKEIEKLERKLAHENLILNREVCKEAKTLKEETGMSIDKARELCLAEMTKLEQDDSDPVCSDPVCSDTVCSVIVREIRRLEKEIDDKKFQLLDDQVERYLLEKEISLTVRTGDGFDKKFQMVNLN
jgi:hypothetical protein